MAAHPARPARFGVAALVVAAVCLSAPGGASALTGAEQLAMLNEQRATHGLPGDIFENPEWSDGCARHMAYLEANGKFQHDEDEADPGYSIEGREAGMGSVLLRPGEAFTAAGVNGFATAPMHLSQLFSPYLQESGAAGGCIATVRDAGRVFDEPRTFSVPGDGSEYVPISEVSSELPYVAAAAVGLGAPGDLTKSVTTGPTLYFFYATTREVNGRKWGRGRIVDASLTGPDGPVEVRTVDNKTPPPPGAEALDGSELLGDYLAPGGLLIPVDPLAKNTAYTAKVSFEPDSGEPVIQRTWAFSTGSLEANCQEPEPGTTPPTPGPLPRPGEPNLPGQQPSPGGIQLPNVGGQDDTCIASALQSPRLRTKAITFTATQGGRIGVKVTFRPAGKVVAEPRTVIDKRLRMKRGRTVQLRFPKKLRRGDYKVAVYQRGTWLVREASTLTRK